MEKWHLHWTLKDEKNFEKNRLEKIFPARDSAIAKKEGANSRFCSRRVIL